MAKPENNTYPKGLMRTPRWKHINATSDISLRRKLLINMLTIAAEYAGMPKATVLVEDIGRNDGLTTGTTIRIHSKFLSADNLDFDTIFKTLFHEETHVVQNISKQDKAYMSNFHGANHPYDPHKTGIETPYFHYPKEVHAWAMQDYGRNIVSIWKENATQE